MKKILISGDVKGNLPFLYQKISQLQSKGQEFDCLLCIGQFLSLTCNNLHPYITNQQQIPLQTYFIESSELSSSLNELYPEGKEICKGLVFLGKSGIKRICGLTVGYLSGIANEKYYQFYDKEEENLNVQFYGMYYSSQDVENICEVNQQLKNQEKKQACVDILLTSEWPMGWQRYCSGKLPKISYESKMISRISKELSPRYHFVGLENVFYQRPPYKTNNFASRLIALGGVEQGNNERYLYAIQLQNINEMEKEALYSLPDDTTENPFAINILSQFSEEQQLNDEDFQNNINKNIINLEENQMLYVGGFDLQNDDSEIQEFLSRWGQIERLDLIQDERTRGHRGYGFVKFKNLKVAQQALNDSNKYTLCGRRIKFDLANNQEGSQVMKKSKRIQVLNCWFCLSNPNVDSSLILWIGQEFYITLDKGPITPGHILLIPIDHIESETKFTQAQLNEYQKLKQQLVKLYKEKFQQRIVFYSRTFQIYQKIAHLHIQCVPVHDIYANQFQEKFHKILQINKLKFLTMHQEDQLKHYLKEQDFYFYIEYSNYSGQSFRELYPMRANKQMQNLPRDFGRQTICEILNLKEKINWKDCQITEQEKSQMFSEYQTLFNNNLA